MTRWGVGPKWALSSAACAAALTLAGAALGNVLAIRVLPRAALLAAGGTLVAVGVPFCVAALVTLHRGFGRGQLFTRGVYGLCRHPIYASWIVFLVPGVLLMAGSWLFLLLPPAMYGLLRFFVRDEETWLEESFGDEYRAYRRRVPAVLPLPQLWQARGNR
jgi:protein-S-isoprenylcysteine O-methyltransferase Ste14